MQFFLSKSTRKLPAILQVILLLSFTITGVFSPAVYAASDTPYFIVGDGSGGGGGGGGTGAIGGDGGGDDDVLDYSSSTATNVIFGDGSGGGGGGRSVGYTPDVRGGFAGSGSDTISGGSGDDVIFGDGFNGRDAVITAFYPGNGGLGGGGGGAAGGNFGSPPGGAAAGICGGGGGGGTLNGGTNPLLVACGDSTAGFSAGGSSGGNGGNAATTEASVQGSGGANSSYNGGGGGGFGGATGGSGSTAPDNGDTDQHRAVDTSSVIHDYFTEAVLRGVLSNYPNYGNGEDIIDGGGGNNELFGLGGGDIFIIDSDDGSSYNRIWDFSAGDIIVFKTGGAVIATVDVNTVVSGATLGDYDSDGNEDDTRLTFEDSTIDLVNVELLTTNDAGEVGTPNSTPTVSLDNSALSYTVSASSTPIDSVASVSDSDGDSDWNGGTLTVQIISNSTANDTLSLSGSNISITNTILKYSGDPVGALSASGGTVTGSNALTITFDSGASNAIVQAIAQNLRFWTSNSGSSDRVVKMTVADNSGATSEDSREIDVSGAPSITYYTVTASAGTGGSISPLSRQVASGSTDSFTVSADSGYAIDNVSGCGGSLSGSEYTTGAVSADCEISAIFTANNYSVSFDSQGGDAVSPITDAYGSSVILPSVSKSGYLLSSWTTKADGTGTEYSSGQVINMPVNGLNLYAQWEVDTTPPDDEDDEVPQPDPIELQEDTPTPDSSPAPSAVSLSQEDVNSSESSTLSFLRTISYVDEEESSSDSSSSSEDLSILEDKIESYDVLVRVRDSNGPIIGADLELHSSPRYATTDSKGEALFTNVEPGDHKLVIRYASQTVERPVTIDGEDKDVDISISVEFNKAPNYWWIVGIAVISLAFILVLVVRLRSKK